MMAIERWAKLAEAKQTLYLLSDTITEKEVTYEVMGATGKVYTVDIAKELLNEGDPVACTCPFYQCGSESEPACKHVYFVLYRVLGVPSVPPLGKDRARWSEDVWNAAVAKKRGKEFEATPKAVLEEFEKVKGKKRPREDEAKEVPVPQRPHVGTECGVCMELFADGAEVVACKTSCGNSVHKKCYELWEKRNPNTCVYCRKRMNFERARKRHMTDDDYLFVDRHALGFPSPSTYMWGATLGSDEELPEEDDECPECGELDCLGECEFLEDDEDEGDGVCDCGDLDCEGECDWEEEFDECEDEGEDDDIE